MDLSENNKDSPDHITIELEFMYYLVYKELKAIEQGDIEGTMDSLKEQIQFLHDHLGAWLPEFSDNIEKNAGTGFFNNLAGFTRTFINKDMGDIQETIEGLSS